MLCCVIGCKKEKSPGGGLPFHSIPKDGRMAKKWRKVIPGKVRESSYVCGNHFKDEDYINHYYIKRLKPSAVPSIFPKVSKMKRARKTIVPSKTNIDDKFDPELLLETFVTQPKAEPKLSNDPPLKSSGSVPATEHTPLDICHNPVPLADQPTPEPNPNNKDSFVGNQPKPEPNPSNEGSLPLTDQAKLEPNLSINKGSFPLDEQIKLEPNFSITKGSFPLTDQLKMEPIPSCSKTSLSLSNRPKLEPNPSKTKDSLPPSDQPEPNPSNNEDSLPQSHQPKPEPNPCKEESLHSARVCQVCLHTDVIIQNNVDDALKDFYLELMHYDLYSFSSLQFCTLCEHMLTKLYNFRQKCRRAHILLKAWGTHARKTSLDSLHTLLPETSIGFWTDASANNIYAFVSSDAKEIKKDENEAYSDSENIENDMDYTVMEEYVPEENAYLPESSNQNLLTGTVHQQNVNLRNKSITIIKKLKKSPLRADKYDKYTNMLKATTLRNTKDKKVKKVEIEYLDSENRENDTDNLDMEEYVQYQNAYSPKTSTQKHLTDTVNQQNVDLPDKIKTKIHQYSPVKRMDRYDHYITMQKTATALRNTESLKLKKVEIEYLESEIRGNDMDNTDIVEYVEDQNAYITETSYEENVVENTDMEVYDQNQNSYIPEVIYEENDEDNTGMEEYVQDENAYLPEVSYEENDAGNTDTEEYDQNQNAYIPEVSYEENDADNTGAEEQIQNQNAHVPETSYQNAYLSVIRKQNAHIPRTSPQKVNLPDKDIKSMDKYDKYIDLVRKGKHLGDTEKKLQYDTGNRSKAKDEKLTKHVKEVILDLIDKGEFSDIQDRGTVLTKEMFLKMLDKTKMKCMSVEKNKIRWFLSTLLQRYNPIYETMFDIERLETQEQMLADFQRQKNSKQYLAAKHKCDICCRIFETEGKRVYHMQWHDSEKPISCDICDMRFDNITALQSHIYYKHKLTFRCKKCDYVTNSNKAMKVHYDSHMPNVVKESRCAYCNKSFKNVSWLRNHISQKHRPRRFWCSICGNNFARAWGLQQHILLKHDDVSPEELNAPPTEQCQHCAAAFHREEALSKHIQLQHVNSDDVMISSCCEKFKDPEDLKAHKMYVHKAFTRNSPKNMPVRYKTCRICKEVHHSRRMYAHHVQNHPEVPYTVEGITKLCDLCGKGYKSQHEYNDHMNIHFGAKPYECSVCGACFASRVGANTHLQRHGPRTYCCDHCGKKFFTSTARAAHLRIHVNDRRYRCETCDKGFLHAASLRHHVDGVHNKIRRVKKKPSMKMETTGRRKRHRNQLQSESSLSDGDDGIMKRDVRDRDEMNEDPDELDDQVFEGDELVKEENELEAKVFERDETETIDRDEMETNDRDEETKVYVRDELENEVYYSAECETQELGEVNHDGEDVMYLVLDDHANEEIVEWDNTE